jgi:predicted lipoprotein with Yx(FWY)xxD motif
VTSNSKRVFTLAAGAAAAVLIAACGSSGGSTSKVTSGGSTQGTTGPQVSVRSTSLGAVLTDPAGKTLYLLTADTATSLACKGSCLQLWVPLMAPSSGQPAAGNGVTGAVGTVARDNGKQVTVGGHPLYTYTADNGPGDTTGQGVTSFGGTWYVVDGTGNAVTAGGGGGGGGGGGASSSPSGGYQY